MKEPSDPEKVAAARVFKASYNFRLKGDPDPIPPQPVMPEALRTSKEDAMSQTDKTALEANYRNGVINKIEGAIVYPHWAKDMKQTGNVAVKVSLAKDGTVASTEWIEQSRHVMLNDEVINAVQRSAPFDPLPEVLGLDHLEIEVTHKFGGR